MIRVNLLPLKETQRAIGQRQQMSIAALCLSVALLLMVVPFVMQGLRLSNLDRDIEGLEREVARLNELTKEAANLDKKKLELQAKLKVIDELNQKRVGPVHVLEGLSTAAPEKLWLIDFNETGGSATITGMALDNQTVALFMKRLGESPYFVNVDLVEATESAPPGALEGTRFKKFIIKAGIDYVGRGGTPDSNGAAQPAAKARP